MDNNNINNSKKVTCTSPPSFWWHDLDDQIECAITLEPVNSLPYPPFLLRKSNEHSTNDADAVVYYFDGVALASYIVSRGIFQNQLTREPLGWDDCRRLDDYLETYNNNNKGQRFGVLEAFALRESVQVRSVVTHNHSGNHDNDNSNNHAWQESRQRRADYLRSEATAA